MRRPLAPCPQNQMEGERVARVCRRGDGRSNTWRLRIAAKSSIASGAPLRFWGGGLGVLLALGVWYSTAGASVRMVGAGGGGGPCATAGRIFSARFESSRVLTGFVLLFCFFVQVFVAARRRCGWLSYP